MDDEIIRRQMAGEFFDWLEIFTHLILLVLLCFTFVFRFVTVDGDSMAPTLRSGDHLCIQLLGCQAEAGDIVVLAPEGERGHLLIKRVIATGGQTVDIDFETHEVRVDGKLLEEPYLAEPTLLQADVHFPVTVPEGHLFVMGDNRNISLDSRNTGIGMPDARRVVGKALLRLSPSTGWID